MVTFVFVHLENGRGKGDVSRTELVRKKLRPSRPLRDWHVCGGKAFNCIIQRYMNRQRLQFMVVREEIYLLGPPHLSLRPTQHKLVPDVSGNIFLWSCAREVYRRKDLVGFSVHMHSSRDGEPLVFFSHATTRLWRSFPSSSFLTSYYL